MQLSAQDAKDLSFVTRDEAVDVVIRLMEQRDELLDALIAITERMENIVLEDQSTPCTIHARAAIAKATQK